MPRCGRLARAVRNSRMLHMYRAGVSINQIAMKKGCTYNFVYEVIAKTRRADDQLDLFNKVPNKNSLIPVVRDAEVAENLK